MTAHAGFFHNILCILNIFYIPIRRFKFFLENEAEGTIDQNLMWE